MHVLEKIIYDTNSQTMIAVMDALCQEVEGWQLTKEDNATFETPYTDEQIEYFNRGVMSVQLLLKLIKNGDL